MSYRIEDHWLIGEGEEVGKKVSPNQGEVIRPEYLIMHCTAGRSAASSVAWLTSSKAKASAHLVIGRDGSVTQLVAFDHAAWHAGESRWADKEGLNHCSIGIELDNTGKLSRTPEGWRTWFGTIVPGDQVMEAVHKDERAMAGWQTYTEAQLKTAMEVGAALVQAYGLKEVLGHDDISPGRKNDPGPAFPMGIYRAYVMGRDGGGARLYHTTDALNLRSGPSAGSGKIVPGGLPKGTRVMPLGPRRGAWWKVQVLDAIDGDRDLEGWVHSRYLSEQGA